MILLGPRVVLYGAWVGFPRGRAGSCLEHLLLRTRGTVVLAKCIPPLDEIVHKIRPGYGEI